MSLDTHDFVTRRELQAQLRLVQAQLRVAKAEMAFFGFIALQIIGFIVWGVVLLWRS